MELWQGALGYKHNLFLTAECVCVCVFCCGFWREIWETIWCNLKPQQNSPAQLHLEKKKFERWECIFLLPVSLCTGETRSQRRAHFWFSVSAIHHLIIVTWFDVYPQTSAIFLRCVLQHKRFCTSRIHLHFLFACHSSTPPRSRLDFIPVTCN